MATTLPKKPRSEQMRQSRFAQGVKFQTDETDRSDGRILVSSGTQSRNRDYWTGKPYRLVPSGMRFDAWAKTGLVLFMHNFNVPLGRNTLYLEEGQLWAPDQIDFHRRIVPIATNNWIGDAIGEFDTSVIADLWEDRYLNSVSIHVMFTQEDEDNILELEDELLIPTSEVIEFSIVTIPGDREANREKLLSLGLDTSLLECLLCDDGKHQGGLIQPGQEINRVGGDSLILPDGGRTGRVEGKPRHSAVHSIPKPEVPMEVEEQGVEEAEGAEVPEEIHVDEPVGVEMELEAEETVLDFDSLELAHAIASDQEALLVLATAFAADSEVLATFVRAIQQNTEHILTPQILQAPAMVQPRIRFVNTRQVPQSQPAPGPEKTMPATIPEAVPPEPVFAPRDPKRRRAVLGLVRS